MQLLGKSINDRTDQQGAEQTLRHGAQCVNAVALQ